MGFLKDSADLIDKYWKWVFQEQLNGWTRNPELWPDKLANEMLLE